MSNARAVLRKVPMFAALSDDDCDAVLQVLKARQGRPGVLADLARRVRATLEPGALVGQLALLDRARRAALGHGDGVDLGAIRR